ncbi:MAG TPA: sigma-70 family RNA polymerase sigma factor [Solirubrobacteraceae bacterium]|jgi:RNA polymerase sigma-70 factor (ECF subfamily)
MDLRDPTIFSGVYARHAADVEAIATRVLGDRAQAQDVAHDVFLRLWVDPGAYDPSRADVGAYLRVLARSRALDAQRSRRAAGRAGDRFRELAERGPTSVVELPCATAEARDLRRELGRALRALPDPQREAVVLSYWGDLPDHQVARRAGVPLGTAKSRIRLGLRRLRAEYETAA